MCPAHLNHYFPGPWLQCVEFWMGCEHPGVPFYQDNLPPTTSRAVAMERILTRSRLLVFRDWMPLQRIISRREVPYGVYFYYAANVEFRKLYPNFLRKTWCEQAQMCLTFWGTTHLHTNAHIRHLDRAGATSEEFIIAQTFLGGCYPSLWAVNRWMKTSHSPHPGTTTWRQSKLTGAHSSSFSIPPQY
ncbi:hypothetical protein B484DRAFT_439053 [Ochromonadaceae sp. CCMP2298]|nr:hypothetical protein B484DRAFT_439053 [Ochromonadaceae sp. CCMP2298]